jgi:hypothetical protein
MKHKCIAAIHSSLVSRKQITRLVYLDSSVSMADYFSMISRVAIALVVVLTTIAAAESELPKGAETTKRPCGQNTADYSDPA